MTLKELVHPVRLERLAEGMSPTRPPRFDASLRGYWAMFVRTYDDEARAAYVAWLDEQHDLTQFRHKVLGVHEACICSCDMCGCGENIEDCEEYDKEYFVDMTGWGSGRWQPKIETIEQFASLYEGIEVFNWQEVVS